MTTKSTNGESDMTVIGRGTTIRGEVDFEHGARILGVFEGKIRSQGEVQIGDTADCRAEIDAACVVIEGKIEGNITARERLRLSETAHLSGDICATKLLVDEGASFVGHCRVGDAADMAAPAASKAKAPAISAPTITTKVSADQIDFKPPWREKDEVKAETGAA